MNADIVALLIGLLGIPGYLLLLGNRFRYRTPPQRGRFWGGIIGHSAGALIAILAMMAPPVWWEGGSMLRDVAVHWSMAGLGLAGLGLGTLVGRLAR